MLAPRSCPEHLGVDRERLVHHAREAELRAHALASFAAVADVSCAVSVPRGGVNSANTASIDAISSPSASVFFFFLLLLGGFTMVCCMHETAPLRTTDDCALVRSRRGLFESLVVPCVLYTTGRYRNSSGFFPIGRLQTQISSKANPIHPYRPVHTEQHTGPARLCSPGVR